MKKASKNSETKEKDNAGFAIFALKRIIPVIIAVIFGMWLLARVIAYFQDRSIKKAASHQEETEIQKHVKAEPEVIPAGGIKVEAAPVEKAKEEHQLPLKIEPPHESVSQYVSPEIKASQSPKASHDVASQMGTKKASKPIGMAFVEASIAPLDYELNGRFWGWRPNDIINFTDNVNNFQLGVLELTRRTSVILAERISRTGVTAAFDPNLERAMNWFMIKAESYLLPSAESRYNDGLNELRAYLKKLEKGLAPFYTRADNLIPLLSAYEDLLGSCEENLVKVAEENGESVSFFTSDDYFYYAKGVASALLTLLEAVKEDFAVTIESRHGMEVLNHAIEACRHATEIDPLIVTNASLSGVLANHRANMAAPISHARFYLGVLIKTLST